MGVLGNDNKKRNRRNKNTVPMLIKKVKTLKIVNGNDLFQINDLSEEIFEEWLKVRNKFRKKLQNKKINDRLYAEFEAEEEIVVGLLSLLNEKTINFIMLVSEAFLGTM